MQYTGYISQIAANTTNATNVTITNNTTSAVNTTNATKNTTVTNNTNSVIVDSKYDADTSKQASYPREFSARANYFDFGKSFFLFVGYFFLSLYLPVGIVFVPFNLFFEFINRPKYVD
jgi:hypothetical protein